MRDLPVLVPDASVLLKWVIVTFYDAAYHAVAIQHSGTLITADDKYYRKTLRAGHVALLGRWTSSPELTGPTKE